MMDTRRFYRQISVSLLVVFITGCATSEKNLYFHKVNLQSISEIAKRTVEDETGSDLSQVGWEIADGYRLSKLAFRPFYTEYQMTVSNPVYARLLASTSSSILANNILGLYKGNLKKIFINPQNLEKAFGEYLVKGGSSKKDSSSHALEENSIAKELYLAVFIHEYIHAVDLLLLSEYMSTEDYLLGASEVFHALLEGHAEYQTGRICEKIGCEKGYEILTDYEMDFSEIDNAIERKLTEAFIKDLKFTYQQGKKFVEYLYLHSNATYPLLDFVKKIPETPMIINHPEEQKLKDADAYLSSQNLIQVSNGFSGIFSPEHWVYWAKIMSPPRVTTILSEFVQVDNISTQSPPYYQSLMILVNRFNNGDALDITGKGASNFFLLIDTGSIDKGKEYLGAASPRIFFGLKKVARIPGEKYNDKLYSGYITTTSKSTFSIFRKDKYILLGLSKNVDFQEEDMIDVADMIFKNLDQMAAK